MEFKKHPELIWRQALSTPFIIGMAVPLVFMDVCAEIYHQVCFRLYGIPLVERRKFLVFGRESLPYLSVPEKFFCWYCSYANGLVHYVSEIAAQTQTYWCGIKHEKYKGFPAKKGEEAFLPYGNEKAYREFSEKR